MSIWSVRWQHLYKDKVQGLAEEKDRFKEALIMAEQSDVVVMCPFPLQVPVLCPCTDGSPLHKALLYPLQDIAAIPQVE